ncbi:hypothetical protein EDB85DRAFT_1900535 [Lactarius pseudohatsudake]|nr:hypothetical protein EDB85DRAFT_1900535 [Lactarius pseudohatsudake]
MPSEVYRPAYGPLQPPRPSTMRHARPRRRFRLWPKYSVQRQYTRASGNRRTSAMSLSAIRSSLYPEREGGGSCNATIREWVSGFLLETRIPIATAVAEASHANGSSSESTSPVSNTNTPILPFHIISTSTLGYALMLYEASASITGHLYDCLAGSPVKAVKEDGSYRGWAPSWYVGQMSSSSGTFATPNITASSTNDSATNTDGPFLAQHAQVSSEQLDE